MDTIREAMLRGQAANRHPLIPVRMWAPADRLVELVRKYHQTGVARVLTECDFRFRGGIHHGRGDRTRVTDEATARDGADSSD
jgi:hypothetical protein